MLENREPQGTDPGLITQGQDEEVTLSPSEIEGIVKEADISEVDVSAFIDDDQGRGAEGSPSVTPESPDREGPESPVESDLSPPPSQREKELEELDIAIEDEVASAKTSRQEIPNLIDGPLDQNISKPEEIGDLIDEAAGIGSNPDLDFNLEDIEKAKESPEVDLQSNGQNETIALSGQELGQILEDVDESQVLQLDKGEMDFILRQVEEKEPSLSEEISKDKGEPAVSLDLKEEPEKRVEMPELSLPEESSEPKDNFSKQGKEEQKKEEETIFLSAEEVDRIDAGRNGKHPSDGSAPVQMDSEIGQSPQPETPSFSPLSSEESPERAEVLPAKEVKDVLIHVGTLLKYLPPEKLEEFKLSGLYQQYLSLLNRLGIE